MTKPGNTLEERLRALYASWNPGPFSLSPDEMDIGILRAAAAIGAELAYEEAASMVEGDCDCRSYADDFRAAAERSKATVSARCPFHSRAWGVRCEREKDHEGWCHNCGDGFAPGWDGKGDPLKRPAQRTKEKP